MTGGTKAQLFTLDLLLALIPLTIALGMSANAISGVATQVQDYTYWYSYHRMVNDAMDVIIKTPGEPPDWNSINPPTTLGLANYTNTSGVGPYYLDSRKVGALNASINGGLLYQVCLSRLLGNETFPYLSLSFLGATVNTTNLSITFINGSRANALNIYAVERLALLDIEKIVSIMEEVGHFETNATPCCGNPGGGTRVYNETFFISSGDLSLYDYWLYGELQSGTVTNKYGIAPGLAGTGCNCTGGTFNNLDNPDPDVKKSIDTELVENSDNILFVRPKGNGQANYYIIRVPVGTPSELILPEIAGAKPIKVILEVGR